MSQCIAPEDVKQIYESLSPEARAALDEVTRCFQENLSILRPGNSPNRLLSTRPGGAGFGNLSGAELIMVLIERGFLGN